MQNKYESQFSQRDIRGQSLEQPSYRSGLSGARRNDLYQQALKHQTKQQLQQQGQDYYGLQQFEAPPSQTNTFSFYHQSGERRIITGDPTAQLMADTLGISYEQPLPQGQAHQPSRYGLQQGQDYYRLQQFEAPSNQTGTFPSYHQNGERQIITDDPTIQFMIDTLNYELPQQRGEGFIAEEEYQPSEASSSQTKLDRVWPLDKYPAHKRVLDTVNNLKGFHQDIDLATLCSMASDTLEIEHPGFREQLLQETPHIQQELAQQQGFTQRRILASTQERSHQELPQIGSLSLSLSQEDTGLFGPLSPLTPPSSP